MQAYCKSLFKIINIFLSIIALRPRGLVATTQLLFFLIIVFPIAYRLNYQGF